MVKILNREVHEILEKTREVFLILLRVNFPIFVVFVVKRSSPQSHKGHKVPQRRKNLSSLPECPFSLGILRQSRNRDCKAAVWIPLEFSLTKIRGMTGFFNAWRYRVW